MLTKLRRHTPTILGLVAAALLFDIFGSLAFSCDPVNKPSNYESAEEYCSAFRGPVFSISIFILNRLGHLIHDEHNVIAALATALIALFTYTLYKSTTGLRDATGKLWEAGERQINTSRKIAALQAKLTRNSIDLARDEFNSSHRPHIIVRDICKDGRNIAYLLVNKGDAPATIVESWIMAEFVPDGQVLRPLRSFDHDDLGRISLAVGEVKDMTYAMPNEIGFAMTFPDTRRIGTDDKPAVHGHTYFTGTIVYSDINGHRRRSVFRRLWNQTSGGFERLKDPDQEYAD